MQLAGAVRARSAMVNALSTLIHAAKSTTVRFLRSRWFLLCAALIGAGVLWRYVIADWLAERRLQEYMADAKARGIRWTLAEYRPAPVPPEEDAALLPVFASTRDYEAMLKQLPNLARGKKTKDGSPKPIDWKATRASLSQLGLSDDPSELDDLRALDAAAGVFQPVVDQLRDSKATAGNWDDEIWNPTVDSSLAQLTTAMKCFRVLDFRARLDLAMGRASEARRSVEAQLRLSRVVRGMPVLISHYVAMSSEALARETVREGMATGVWDDEALRAFSNYFHESNELAGYQWAIETERAWSRGVMDSLRSDPDLVLRVLSFPGLSLGKIDEWLLRFAVSRPAWHLNNQLWYERAHDELATSIDAKAGTWRPIERQFDPGKLTEKERRHDLMMAAQSMNMMRSLTEKAVWTHAQNKMAAIACALELARRATGSYPATLEALVPAYLAPLPIDPTSGSSFLYSVRPDGSYRLHSIGFDRKDQGGEITEDSDRDLSDPDWPWFGPRARATAE